MEGVSMHTQALRAAAVAAGEPASEEDTFLLYGGISIQTQYLLQ